MLVATVLRWWPALPYAGALYQQQSVGKMHNLLQAWLLLVPSPHYSCRALDTSSAVLFLPDYSALLFRFCKADVSLHGVMKLWDAQAWTYDFWKKENLTTSGGDQSCPQILKHSLSVMCHGYHSCTGISFSINLFCFRGLRAGTVQKASDSKIQGGNLFQYVVLQGETLNLFDSWPMCLQYATPCMCWGVTSFSEENKDHLSFHIKSGRWFRWSWHRACSHCTSPGEPLQGPSTCEH